MKNSFILITGARYVGWHSNTMYFVPVSPVVLCAHHFKDWYLRKVRKARITNPALAGIDYDFVILDNIYLN